jgi:hypothetical protein
MRRLTAHLQILVVKQKRAGLNGLVSPLLHAEEDGGRREDLLQQFFFR